MGLLFQIPVGILAVTRLGIVTPRQLRKNRRYAILVIAVVAMLLPGQDPVTMLCSWPRCTCSSRALSCFPGCSTGAPPRRGGRRGGRSGASDARTGARHPRSGLAAPMLFDLRSAGRRRTVKIVYLGLALLMFVGFVGFSIGSSGLSGGIVDAIWRRRCPRTGRWSRC